MKKYSQLFRCISTDHRHSTQKYNKKRIPYAAQCYNNRDPYGRRRIKVKEITEAAEEMQEEITLMKRWSNAPPYRNEKKPILDALSIFKEGRKKQNTLGCELSKNFDDTKYESSRKRQRTEDEE